MKIILSRKGFDSSAGGSASPILPGGAMVSMPIPDPQSPIRYGEIRQSGHDLGRLAEQLTNGRVGRGDGAHLDPDLAAEALPRRPGWRPLFGQAGAAQGHLRNQGVGSGDLFLFFGWYREVERVGGVYRFRREAPDLHVLFGWFQIESALDLAAGLPAREDWRRDHPHCHGRRGVNNVLYTATRQLRLPGYAGAVAGAGLFGRYAPRLCLTAPGGPRGRWRAPGWLHPAGRASTLTYHRNPDRWRRVEGGTELHCAARGQDFVLDCDDYPEAVGWAWALCASAVQK